MLENHAWEIFGAVLSVLLSINAFFVYRLVKNIDSSNQMAGDTASKMTVLENELRHVKEKVDQMTDLREKLTNLEKELAVLNYIVKKNQGAE